MPKFCANCGAALDDAKRFCGDCGAPISDLAQAEPPKPSLPACHGCGAALEEGANFCESCGLPVFANNPGIEQIATRTRISARYHPFWLAMTILMAITWYALPESLLKTGLPPYWDSPIPWVVSFLIFCLLAWFFDFLARRRASKRPFYFYMDPPIAIAASPRCKKLDEDVFARRYYPPTKLSFKSFWRIPVKFYAPFFTSLTLLVAIGISLLIFKTGQIGKSIFPAATTVPGNSVPGTSAAAPWVTRPSGTSISTTPEAPKKGQSLDGIWLPYEESVSSNGGGSVDGVPVPHMSSIMPSILFENGHMFMGFGSTRDEIRQYAKDEHHNISGFEGYPFILAGGVITISDPYTATPDKAWEIDSDLNVYIGGSVGFIPSTEAHLTD